MNCQKVTAILDDQNIAALDAVLRRQVEAHVEGCVECARAWNTQLALAALPGMAEPQDFHRRCRAAVAAGSRPAARRTGRGMLVAGSLVALAAAAAVIASLSRPSGPATPAVEAITVETPRAAVVDAVPAKEPTAALLPAAAVDVPAEATFSVRLVLLQASPNASVDVESNPDGNSRVTRSDPYKEQALQSFHSAMRDGLRRLPGLRLVEEDPVDAGASSQHYLVRIGGVTAYGPDGRLMPGDSRRAPVAMSVEQLLPGGKKFMTGGMMNSDIDLLASCSGSAPAAGSACRDARGVAAAMVQQLRRKVFPPDASVTRPLQAGFQDASQDPNQRLELLVDLYKQQQRVGGNNLLRDTGVVRAAVRLASDTDPMLRAIIWRSLRGVGNRELVEPLITSLQQDPEEVRLAAIETLSTDFTGDMKVRSMLEATVAGDTSPLVRAVAQRALSGEPEWRRYVVASLEDSSLPAAQRVEALVYYLYPPGPDASTSPDNPDYFKILQELLDDSALSALGKVLPAAGRVRGDNLGLLMSNVGYRFDKNPAITEMLLDYLERDPSPNLRMSAGQVLANTRAADPRVRDALAKALGSDPDPRVRDWVQQSLGGKAP